MPARKTFRSAALRCAFLTAALLTGACLDATEEDVTGTWRGNNGSLLTLAPDGSCRMQDFDWEELFFEPGEVARLQLEQTCRGEWEQVPDVFSGRKNSDVEITILTNGGEFMIVFRLHFTGRGILASRRPYDLYFYIGDPDCGRRRTFTRICRSGETLR